MAQKIAKSLVAAKLAACINIIPKVISIYRWEGKVECETETQLFIKTRQECFANLSLTIKELHPYTTVEIIALDIAQGNQDYLNWITESLK